MLLIGDKVEWNANGIPCKGLVYDDQIIGGDTIPVMTFEINGKRAKILVHPLLTLLKKI